MHSVSSSIHLTNCPNVIMVKIIIMVYFFVMTNLDSAVCISVSLISSAAGLLSSSPRTRLQYYCLHCRPLSGHWTQIYVHKRKSLYCRLSQQIYKGRIRHCSLSSGHNTRHRCINLGPVIVVVYQDTAITDI